MKNFATQKGQSLEDNGFDGKFLCSSPVFSDRYYLIPDSLVLSQAKTQSFLNNSSLIFAKLKPNLGKTQAFFSKTQLCEFGREGPNSDSCTKKSLSMYSLYFLAAEYIVRYRRRLLL